MPYDIEFTNFDTGEVINGWNLNPSQLRFWNSEKRVILFSGGFGCGKSMMLILKAIDLCLKYPNNFILMGRRTYIELRDTLLKEFFILCPPILIDFHLKAEMKVRFVNGSEIVFRHLDKIAASEIRSMNLGAVFIDQAEDTTKDVFLALKGRLRRDGIEGKDRKICMSINPELTWHFAEFKQNPKEEYELIEASTLENEKNLPKEYIQDLMNYPENYKRQYVYGIWDESLLAGNTVFDREFQEKIAKTVMAPIDTREGLKIYKNFIPGHRYQMGIDVAEGSEENTDKKDRSCIAIVDLTNLEEVANWTGQVPPDVVAEKAAKFARWYQNPKTEYCTIIPEMNSIGLALVNKLQEYDDIYIYRREEFDKTAGKRLKRMGWRTTRQSKPLLVNRFQELLRKSNPKIRTAETVEEFKTFVYSDDARKSGMGAKEGFHDDRIMATLLAFFEKGDVVPGKVLTKGDIYGKIKVEIEPTITIKNGKARFTHLQPILEIQKKWTTI